MERIEFTLKQHTPIIHFQHNQAGATLRATEVKPKLDRFIMEKLLQGEGKTSGNGYNEFRIIDGKKEYFNIEKAFYDYAKIKENEWLKWLKVNGEHISLSYKINIAVIEEVNEKDRESLNEFEKIDIDNIGKPKFKLDKDRNIKTDEYGAAIYDRGIGFKGYFGNMEKETERKVPIIHETIKISFLSMCNGLKIEIKKHFNEFIFISNFGTRTSKGFGSFYIKDNEDLGNQSNYYSFFDVTVENKKLFIKLTDLFETINYFYSSLRSGINIKNPIKINDGNGRKVIQKDANGVSMMKDIYYFKSLAFLYAYQKHSIQWEKKTIKRTFFYNDLSRFDTRIGSNRTIYYGLNSQQLKRNVAVAMPLNYSSENKKIVKDLFGLSSTETWLSYNNATISKTEAIEKNTKVKEENQKILRYKSPIQFKPIKINDNTFRVYIQILENEPLIQDKWFCIESSKSNNQLFLKTLNKTEFTIANFFRFVFEEKDKNDRFLFNINNHVETKFHNYPVHKTLKKLFDEIKNNIRHA